MYEILDELHHLCLNKVKFSEIRVKRYFSYKKDHLSQTLKAKINYE